MSRSVSAPSSVTNTSPCWYGDIVPGSTLMYGSNFCRPTVRPRETRSRPREAAAMPFPRLETTPPVTKMYRVLLAMQPFRASVEKEAATVASGADTAVTPTRKLGRKKHGEDRQDRRAVARGALARGLLRPAHRGHRAAVHRQVQLREG